MIPVRLHLSGFLSYLDPVDVDFDEFDLACISGQNGAGKSSLLDAITWVLFGEARRRDDSIINNRAEAAEVALTFEYENNVYRIQRTKPKNKTTLLEFAIRDGNTQWKPLTEPTLRATEDLVRKTLRLDYETFTNASFFLQGKADQFAQQKPSDRKRILSSILGLDIWDEYKEETARRRNDCERSLTAIEAVLKEIDDELSQESARKEKLADLEKEFQAQNDLSKARKKIVDQQRLMQESLKGDERQLEKQAAELNRLEKELEKQNELLKTRQEERAALQQQLAREPEIKAAHAAWKQAQKDLEGWDALAANFQKYDHQRQPLLQEIKVARTRLESEIQNFQATAADIARIQNALPALKVRSLQQQNEMDRLAEQAAQRPVLEKDLRDLADQRGQAKAENEKLRVEGNELNERIKQLSDIKTPLCPVCGKPLSDTERAKMMEDLMAEVQAKRENYQKNNDLLKNFSNRYAELENSINLLVNVEKQLENQKKSAALLERELTESEKILRDWQEQGLPHLQGLQQKLQQNDYARDEQQKLADLDARLKELGYDAAAHESVRKTEMEGRASQEALIALEKSRSALTPVEREMDEIQKNLEQKESHYQEVKKEYLEASAQLNEKRASLPDLTQSENEYFTLQENVNRLRDQVSAARNEVTVLDRQREKKQLQNQAKDSTLRQIAQLKLLEKAFGKDGIPALLIEQALPEIEKNANEILDRLSDGNMSVRFETQREFKDKKRDDRKETLDILIRDGQGERDYELFSGGEAFRVNFAIRLALSRVLAHRAGARLQTLVIDEGFGSQDVEGRQRLIEAINLARSDFAKVLVITHMEELKDAFPARIDVQKTEQGSRVEVVTA